MFNIISLESISKWYWLMKAGYMGTRSPTCSTTELKNCQVPLHSWQISQRNVRMIIVKPILAVYCISWVTMCNISEWEEFCKANHRPQFNKMIWWCVVWEGVSDPNEIGWRLTESWDLSRLSTRYCAFFLAIFGILLSPNLFTLSRLQSVRWNIVKARVQINVPLFRGQTMTRVAF